MTGSGKDKRQHGVIPRFSAGGSFPLSISSGTTALLYINILYALYYF